MMMLSPIKLSPSTPSIIRRSKVFPQGSIHRNRHVRHYSGRSDVVVDEEVLYHKKGSSVNVVLNRPDKLNSLNLNMVRILTPLYLEWNNDPSVKNIVMTGAGNKAFCAGGDIVAITTNKQLGADFFKEEFMLNYLIGTLGKPQVAIIDGITMGGGVGLSVHGKFRVATEKSLFAMPETGIGYFCDVGGTYFLPRLKNNLGMYLGLSGARLKGYDLLKSGVATHYVPSENIPSLLDALSTTQENSDAEVDDIINEFIVKRNEETEIDIYKSQIIDIFGSETLEQVLQKLETDSTEWAQKTLSKILSASPTSVRVVFDQLKLGAKLNLEECFKVEYKISQEFLRNHDFIEGVDSLLIRKDGKPQWDPKTISEVTSGSVEKYFNSPEEIELIHHLQNAKL